MHVQVLPTHNAPNAQTQQIPTLTKKISTISIKDMIGVLSHVKLVISEMIWWINVKYVRQDVLIASSMNHTVILVSLQMGMIISKWWILIHVCWLVLMVPLVMLLLIIVKVAHISLIVEIAYLHVPTKLMLTQPQVKLFALIVQLLITHAMIGTHSNLQPQFQMMANLYSIKFIYLKVFTVA